MPGAGAGAGVLFPMQHCLVGQSQQPHPTVLAQDASKTGTAVKTICVPRSKKLTRSDSNVFTAVITASGWLLDYGPALFFAASSGSFFPITSQLLESELTEPKHLFFHCATPSITIIVTDLYQL